MDQWNGREERRKSICLSKEQIDEIAESASEKAIEKMRDYIYKEIGKNLTQKFIWILIATITGGYIWLQSKGIIHG
jgi:hypothetical protein